MCSTAEQQQQQPDEGDLETARWQASLATSTSKVTHTDEEESRSRSRTIKPKTFRNRFDSHRLLARHDPQHIILALFLFAVLVAAGISIASVFANTQQRQMESDALTLAQEAGLYFSQHLDQAILPVFTLAQFVNEIEAFRTLPERIGLTGANGSLPLLPPRIDGGVATHRNVTGVCDDESLREQYKRIAGAIKKDSQLDGILVNLQLVPDAVVCLVHPINNTEDFPPGIYMDNTGAIGHDLLNDPVRKFIAEATVSSETVVVAGPLKLQQCHDCDPMVEKAFIARLPIKSATNNITVNGESHARWGFAAALINWNELVKRTGVYETFKTENMEFQLTRTDFVEGADGSTFVEKIVVLAESQGFDASIETQVHAALPPTDNEWEITVVYCPQGCATWYSWVILVWLILSILISALVYTIFSQKQFHYSSLAAKSEQMLETAERSARVERELNDFIAHEVRNPLAAAMSACSFISASVNENESWKEPGLQDIVREDVHIVESSLQFVNDLLRSMLDLHRAKSDQMVLEYVPTDMKSDILQPVATMIYRRDEAFDVEIDCPDDLVFSTDRLRLKQIVLNLARNAAKFVESGFVRLRAKRVEGGDVLIYIEDSGPGIPEGKRVHLFAKFQESLDALNQGTGIGLSLCQKLIDLMGGSITLDLDYHSGIDERPGAKFDIRLPCQTHVSKMNVEDSTSETAEMDDQDHEDGCDTSPVNQESLLRIDIETPQLTLKMLQDSLPEKLKVLFVDDDMILRKLFLRSLKRVRPDWSVYEASNGETAIALVSEQKEDYDIIFCDQYMTSVEKQLLGTETARLLRSKGYKNTICGLSANDMESAFLQAGANAFMIKPFPCKPEPLVEELVRVYNSR